MAKMAKLITEPHLSMGLNSDPLYHRPEIMDICISRLKISQQCKLTTHWETLSRFIFEKHKDRIITLNDDFMPREVIILFFFENNLPIPAFFNINLVVSTQKLAKADKLEFDYYFEQACEGMTEASFEELENSPIDKLILKTYVSLKHIYNNEPTAGLIMDELHNYDSAGILCSASKPVIWEDKKGNQRECSIHRISRFITLVRRAIN